MSERTHNQKLADTLRRKEYRGCRGQVSAHGAGKASIQIFAENTPENARRFTNAKKNAQGTLVVADFDV